MAITTALFVSAVLAQDKTLADVVKENSHPIVVSNKRLSGRGVEILDARIKDAQFLVLGENHYSSKLSQFSEALLNEKSRNFTHFILEIGPVAVDKIYELYDRDEAVFTGKLNRFLTKYKLNDSPPIEFISMKADAGMLSAATANNVRLYGVDKEYVDSTYYLLDELKKYADKKDDLARWTSVKARVDEAYEKRKADDKAPLLSALYADKGFIATLRSINPRNPKAALVTEEFIKVLYIYGLYEIAKYSEQNTERLKIMKQRLGALYFSQMNAKKPFKGFIKIGNVHSDRGLNRLLQYDIGNTASELAEAAGSRSVNIYGMRRYRKSATGEVSDFLKDGYEPLLNFVSLTDKENFVLIDLAPIKDLYLGRKIKIESKDERDLVIAYDFILLTPVDGAYKESRNY
jgi:hypothetical protein